MQSIFKWVAALMKAIALVRADMAVEIAIAVVMTAVVVLAYRKV